MIILGLAESIMNRTDPTVTLFDDLFVGNYKRQGLEILKGILIQVFILCHYNLGSMNLMVWKPRAVQQRSNFRHFSAASEFF